MGGLCSAEEHDTSMSEEDLQINAQILERVDTLLGDVQQGGPDQLEYAAAKFYVEDVLYDLVRRGYDERIFDCCYPQFSSSKGCMEREQMVPLIRKILDMMKKIRMAQQARDRMTRCY